MVSFFYVLPAKTQTIPAQGWAMCLPRGSVQSMAVTGKGNLVTVQRFMDCEKPQAFVLRCHDFSGAELWSKHFAHNAHDYLVHSVQAAADGGLLISASIMQWPTATWHWLIKTNEHGDTLWTRTYAFSYSGLPVGAQMIGTTDGGALFCSATTTSNQWDVLVIRLDAEGNELWYKTFGGTQQDYALDAIEVEGGFLIAATTASSDLDVTNAKGGTDVWLLRLDHNGTLVWQTCLGGSLYDEAVDITPSGDGNFFLAGNSTSNDGDVTGHHGGPAWFDYWLVKISANGTLLWQKSLGGSHYDVAAGVVVVDNTWVVVAGTSYSKDGNVSDHKGTSWYGDFWIATLDQSGNLWWTKSFGGTNYDLAASITALSGGWVAVAGSTLSSDGDVPMNCVLDTCYTMESGFVLRFHASCSTPAVSQFEATPLGNGMFSFLNQSTQATSYLWEFGDGAFSYATDTTHQYLSNQKFEVCLTALNDCSQDILCKTISTCSPLNASFIHESAGLTVSFTNTTPHAMEVLWDFGDGTFSSVPNPVHTFPQAGLFDVTLTVTDSCQGQAAVTQTVSTCGGLAAEFNYTLDEGVVQFFDLSQGQPSDWFWDFGDGNSSMLQHPTHNFTLGQNFNVCLTVSAQDCPNVSSKCVLITTCTSNVQAHFTASSFDNTISFMNTTVGAESYFWDFGDGHTSTEVHPVHTYPPGLGIYQSCLVAYDNCGSDTFCTKLYMGLGPVTAHFLYVTLGLSVSFTNLSTNAVSFWWDFGDGTTSTDPHPFHIYSANGVYTVCLVAYDVLGNSDTLCQNVSVCLPLTAAFGVVKNYLTVSFIDQTSDAVQWLWNFGDGHYSAFQHPTHAYAANGTYTVCLIATNVCGLSDTTCSVITVCDQLATSYTYQSNYLSVSFNDLTQGSTSWLWSFGNGSFSFLQHPVYNYPTAGTYNVCLTTSNACGQYSTHCQPITVCAPVVANYTHTASNLTIQFSDLTPNAVQWKWDFDDGNTSTLKNPEHTYAANGNYNVCLIASNVCGYSDTICKTITTCAPLASNFSYADSFLTVAFTDQTANAVSWVWYLGDGAISFDQNPVHTYAAAGNYEVCLVASDICNNYTQSCQTITVCDTIKAAYGFSTFYLTTIFNNQTASGNSWLWHFGDGASSTMKNPTHTYTSNGTYNACLIATDACGRSDTLCQAVTVCSPLVAAFQWQIDYLNVTFTATTPTAVAWHWTFGDGNSSSLPAPQHTYAANGNYTVCLIATDWCGKQDTLCKTITVCAPLQAAFSWQYNNLVVTFTNNTPNSLIWLWDFGDGNISFAEHPVHEYAEKGTYTVCLIVFDLCGSSDTLCQIVDITCPPFLAQFTYLIDDLTVHFTDQSTNSISWQWDFGDGTTSLLPNPSHTYADTGTYLVCLISRDSCSSDTACKLITLKMVGTVPWAGWNDGVFLSPNPADRWIRLRLPAIVAEPVFVHIYNVWGQRLQSMHINDLTLGGEWYIPTHHWPAGPYLIEVRRGDLWHHEVIIIQRK